MIMKLLLIIGVISIIYFMFIKKKSSINSQKKATKGEAPQVNDMIECASCGVYVEINEAILSGTKYYCSKECLSAKV